MILTMWLPPSADKDPVRRSLRVRKRKRVKTKKTVKRRMLKMKKMRSPVFQFMRRKSRAVRKWRRKMRL